MYVLTSAQSTTARHVDANPHATWLTTTLIIRFTLPSKARRVDTVGNDTPVGALKELLP